MVKIALVYIGELRFAEQTRLNHQAFINKLKNKYIIDYYDFTHQNRTWSTQGLCGEQAQILDTHYALQTIKSIHNNTNTCKIVVIKMRTDIWICDGEDDKILSYVDKVCNNTIDFVYIGTNFMLDDKLTCQLVSKDSYENSRFVTDLIVIFDSNCTNDVPKLFLDVPEESKYSLNQGWWLLAKVPSACAILYADVYVVKQNLESFDDTSVVNAWFNFAYDVEKNTPMYKQLQCMHERWNNKNKEKA
jgi:hypothetical protein